MRFVPRFGVRENAAWVLTLSLLHRAIQRYSLPRWKAFSHTHIDSFHIHSVILFSNDLFGLSSKIQPLSHSTCENRHGLKTLGQLLSNYPFHTDARCTQVCTDSWRNPTLRGSAPGSRRKESPCSHSYCPSSDIPEHCQRSQLVNRGHKTERERAREIQSEGYRLTEVPKALRATRKKKKRMS